MSNASILGQVVLAGELIDDIQNKLGEIKGLLLTALAVFGIWIVLKIFLKTGGALVAVLIPIATLAVVLWGANNVDWLKDKLGSELTSNSAPAYAPALRGPARGHTVYEDSAHGNAVWTATGS